jgi:hypothetical protein
LPHMPARLVVAMISLRVRHQQALHDAADGRARRSQQQMKVIAEQAVTVQLERLPLLELGQGM